ncbi:MAG: hypothetical protein ABI763_10650 [Bacteroidota bacterium]
MDFGLLFGKLNEFNVRYVVCGGLAVNLHGVPRMTADIDIILDLEEGNLLQFEMCVAELKYNVSVPVKISDLSDELTKRNLIQTKSLIALSYFNYDKNMLALDVLIDFPVPFEELWNQRVVKKEGNISLNVVSIDHLIALKEFSSRAQDKQDIYYLSKIKNGK